MVPRLRPTETIAALIMIAALSACARQGPPAPVVMWGNNTASRSAESTVRANPELAVAPVIREGTARGDATQSRESTASQPRDIVSRQPAHGIAPAAPAKSALPVTVVQHHRPHPDHVVVARGETLYMISRRYDLPLRSIIDANHLEPPYRLDAGVTLTLPQQRFHFVRPGDTLYSISRAYGVEVSALVRLNHLSPPYGIRIGQAIQLPPAIEKPERIASTERSAPARLEPPPPAKPSTEEEAAAAAPQGDRVFLWPIKGRILAAYGTQANGIHNDGINIAARLGEPVRAAASGVVAYAGNELRGYGNLILIKHADGYMTAYAHNARLLVRRGERVRRGQEIATAGETGAVRTPQLHFEIRRGTRALDPMRYLPILKASAG